MNTRFRQQLFERASIDPIVVGVDVVRSVIVARPWKGRDSIEIEITETALAAAMEELTRTARHLWLEISDVEGAWRLISEGISEVTDSASPWLFHLELSPNGELQFSSKPRTEP